VNPSPSYHDSHRSSAKRIFIEYQQYTLYPNFKESGLKIIENKEKIPWSNYVGVAGMPGELMKSPNTVAAS